MERNYSADDVIELPRMNASSALSLGESLLSAARTHGVPRIARRAHDRLESAVAALSGALVAEVARSDANPEAVVADRVLDAVWGAIHSWLLGWSKLPEAPQAVQAKTVFDAVFPNGLAFTQRAFIEEWSESEVRLKRLSEDHDDTLGSLGGGPFLQALRKAHKAYGEALNITTAAKDSQEIVKRRPSLDELAASLRGYVLKVAAHADDDDDDTAAQSNALLRPLRDFRSRGNAGVEKSTPVEEPKPSS